MSHIDQPGKYHTGVFSHNHKPRVICFFPNYSRLLCFQDAFLHRYKVIPENQGFHEKCGVVVQITRVTNKMGQAFEYKHSKRFSIKVYEKFIKLCFCNSNESWSYLSQRTWALLDILYTGDNPVNRKVQTAASADDTVISCSGKCINIFQVNNVKYLAKHLNRMLTLSRHTYIHYFHPLSCVLIT